MLGNCNSTAQCWGSGVSFLQDKHTIDHFHSSMRGSNLTWPEDKRVFYRRISSTCQFSVGHKVGWIAYVASCALLPAVSGAWGGRHRTAERYSGWRGGNLRAVNELMHETWDYAPRSSRSLNTTGCTYIKLQYIYMCTQALMFTYFPTHTLLHKLWIFFSF